MLATMEACATLTAAAAVMPQTVQQADALQRGQAVRCGAQQLAWPHGVARAVLDCPEISAVPHAPVWLAGAANIDGRVVPVLDLAAWFVPGTLTDTGHRETRVLVLGDGEETVAVLFNGLPRLVRLKTGGVPADANPASAADGYVIGCAVDDPHTLLMDHAALLQAIHASLSDAAA